MFADDSCFFAVASGIAIRWSSGGIRHPCRHPRSSLNRFCFALRLPDGIPHSRQVQQNLVMEKTHVVSVAELVRLAEKVWLILPKGLLILN